MNEQQLEESKINLEVTGDSVVVLTILKELISAMKKYPTQNRERSLVITKLQEAKSWLIEAQAVES